MFPMEGLQGKPHQFGGLETKPNREAEALEEHSLPSETWSKNSNKAEEVVEDSTISIPLLGLILKMPTPLEPVCFAGSPFMLPVGVQLAGGVEPLTPVITPTPSCLTLPLICDQPHMQHLNHLSSCPISEQQNCPYSLQQINGLTLPLGQSQSDEPSQPFENTAVYDSEFVAALQESFPLTCSPLNDFTAGFIPPNTSMSPLYNGSSVLPPSTLLVPFPFVVPLPVPLPIPIPIPIPNFPDTTSSLSRASHTMKTSQSTQTMTEDIPMCTHSRMSGCDFLQLPTQPPALVSQEQVLDLTVKVVPIQTKQEVQFSFRQDNVLDLSMASKSCLVTGKDSKLKHHGRNSIKEKSTKLILPVKRSQTQSNDEADMELSMQYHWTTKKHSENYALKYSRQRGFISPKQTPRSTKDTSIMFHEKLVRLQQGKEVNPENINIPQIKKQRLLKSLPGN